MPRSILAAFLLGLLWLAAACSPNAQAETKVASASPTETPLVYGPWPVDFTPSPSPRATSPTTPAATATPTPTPIVVLDPDAQRAREHVLRLADLPAGFVAQRIRVVSNADAASDQADPAAVLADYARWGRITGFEAAYSRLGSPAESGLAAVESVASVYSSAEGARASLEDFRARSSADGAAAVSMPALGDESVAVLLGQTSSVGSARTSWLVYAIRVREGDLLLSVNGYGFAGSLSFDEVLALARATLGESRSGLPVPLPTATPTPIPPATPTAAPSGSADLTVLSYRAYRASTGGAVVVVGEARNQGSAPAERVQIAVSLLDAAGKVLGAASVNAAQLGVIPPGGVYPFRVVVDRVAGGWADVRIQLQPMSAGESPTRRPVLQAEGVSLVSPGSGVEGFGLAGDVINLGATSARGVRIVAVAYDGQGRVRDVAVTSAKLDPIAPGGRSPFALIWGGVLTEAPSRYELLVDGRAG